MLFKQHRWYQITQRITNSPTSESNWILLDKLFSVTITCIIYKILTFEDGMEQVRKPMKMLKYLSDYPQISLLILSKIRRVN